VSVLTFAAVCQEIRLGEKGTAVYLATAKLANLSEVATEALRVNPDAGSSETGLETLNAENSE
jgi:hypothetical protein